MLHYLMAYRHMYTTMPETSKSCYHTVILVVTYTYEPLTGLDILLSDLSDIAYNIYG